VVFVAMIGMQPSFPERNYPGERGAEAEFPPRQPRMLRGGLASPPLHLAVFPRLRASG
jgi:hypothetical protein